uniref:MYND-type domain-containing protein n=1 Tax=Plectus sambesii TaxID=2011161 RepID=A0A914WUL5_9BILA
MPPPSSIYDRMKVFEEPFAYLVNNANVETFCSYCLRTPEGSKLSKCGGCDFARYCNKDCQRLAWKDHKPECARLKKSFPNLPLTEVLFLSRLMDRVAFLEKNGDRYGWEKDRKWSELLTHEEEIKEDKPKYAHFEKIYSKTLAYHGEDKMIPKEQFFIIFCKAAINSHSIHTNAGTEVGMALDLGVSQYDHSCRPNCTLIFDGFRACLRPLTPDTNASDAKTSFISYIDVGRSRYQRRRDLKSKWYFDCQCSRCLDTDDDILTAIKCSTPGCDEPLITTEDSEPMYIACPKCKNTTEPDVVAKAQEFMRSLPGRFVFNATQEEVNIVEDLLTKAKSMLHPKNIYFCRLQTAYLQMAGEQDALLVTPETQKQVYENYRLCFPKADRHIGYQLLHLVKSLIEKGEREEATTYAYEAMAIFEVCFGLEHPYYLQTLALWTYLDTKADKTNEELIKLMNFNYNRPVNISQLLKGVQLNDAPTPKGVPSGRHQSAEFADSSMARYATVLPLCYDDPAEFMELQ